jgi:hypothetical protein
MDKFSKKTAMKELLENKDAQQNQLHSLKQAIMAIYQKLYQMDSAIQGNQRVSSALDFRSRAIVSLLEKVGISEKEIKDQVQELQVEQFDRDSAEDDKKRNLVPSEGPAASGQYATTTIRVFKDGLEVESERIVRSKVQLGKAEFLPEVDEAVLGMNVGETKSFPLNLQERTDTAEVTLLSLKEEAKAPEATTTTDGSENGNS